MKRISVIGLLFIILCVFFRVFGGEICLVPSSSMEPAILIGDWLWIDKLTYGARLPVRLHGTGLYGKKIEEQIGGIAE